MSKLVTIFGGSGFVGRYIVRRMAKEGWRVRVAVRNPNEALHVKPYGAVGQVEPVFCNIRDDASVAAAMLGADAAVNCVGTFDKGGRNSFAAVQAEGAGRIARIAAEQGVGQLVHISSIGADAEAESDYSKTKAAGEANVLAHFPNAMILRPSVIFGIEDNFFNRFASMATWGPVLPIVGAETRFQPVHVDDVAQAAVAGILGRAKPGIYELGGPEVLGFRQMMTVMLGVIRRRRMIANLPWFAARALALGLGAANFLSLGIIPKLITADQIKDLKVDNVAHEGVPGLKELGIEPRALSAVLPDYLWRFRPSGQYSEIKASAKNLKA